MKTFTRKLIKLTLTAACRAAQVAIVALAITGGAPTVPAVLIAVAAVAAFSFVF
jgi:hypothetical protein